MLGNELGNVNVVRSWQRMGFCSRHFYVKKANSRTIQLITVALRNMSTLHLFVLIKVMLVLVNAKFAELLSGCMYSSFLSHPFHRAGIAINPTNTLRISTSPTP